MDKDQTPDITLKITAVLCVRNEAAFLLDWVAWHRAVGITDFVIVSNDCDDGTDVMLDRLSVLGGVTHIRNAAPYGKGGIQFSGLKLASKTDAVRTADWLIVLDIDEFINVHAGNRTLTDVIAAVPDATAVTLTWRVFGNAGVVAYEDQPVPVQFTRTGPRSMPWPWRAAMFKTLYRNDRTYRNLGVHRPRNPVEARVSEARWFDGSGRELGPEMATSRIFSDYTRDNHALVQLNHYPLGAIHSYVLKSDRGRAVHSKDVLGLDYWVERNLNTETDLSGAQFWAAAQPYRDELTQDETLVRLHADAVQWRKHRFEALMAEDRFRDLFGRLLMAGGSQPLAARHAALLLKMGFAARSAATGSSSETS